jgi:hypothetical protein
MKVKPKTNPGIFEPLNIAKSIDSDFNDLDINESLGIYGARKKDMLFLRALNKSQLMKIMTDVKLIPHLNSNGFNNIILDIEYDDSFIHYLKLYNEEKSPDNILLDLRLSETKFTPDAKFFKSSADRITYDMIVIEWLSAQNPNNRFLNDKPQLPGQKAPGLGILKYCFEMMYIVAKTVIKDGFMDIPDHVHGAIMYAKKFKFFDPRHEGALRAMMRDLKEYSLADISWGIMTQTIIEIYKNQPQPYDPSEQIFYVSRRMRNYFHSDEYMSVYKKYYKRKHFRFDYDRMVEMRTNIMKNKNLADL